MRETRTLPRAWEDSLTLQDWIEHINALADETSGLEPNPQDSWTARTPTLNAISDRVEKELLPHAEQALEEIEDAEERAAVASAAVQVLESAAVLLMAAGQQSVGLRWLARITPLARDTPEEQLLEAARLDPQGFLQLSQAWWHLRAQNLARAHELAEPLAHRSGAIGEQAQQIIEAPRPIASAPTLYTLNGCGVSIYGERDARSDGTFVKTRYLTLLFVPIIPLDAYRVADAGDEGYYFIGKVPLTGAAKTWRLVSLLALLAIPAWLGVQAYLGSPRRQFSIALDEVRASANAAKTPKGRDALLRRYEELLDRYGALPRGILEPAATDAVKLLADRVPRPVTLTTEVKVRQAIKRFEAWPAGARYGASGYLVKRVRDWAKQLAQKKEPTTLAAAASLLKRGVRLSMQGTADGVEALKRQQKDIERQLALDLAKRGWVLEALRRLAKLHDKSATLAMGKLLAEIDPKELSIWAELAPIIPRFSKRVSQYKLPQFAAVVKAAKESIGLAKKRKKEPARKALLEQKVLPALRKAVKHAPRDQELVVALANQLRQTGESKEALAVMESLGKPGMLVRMAQSAYASLLLDAGRLPLADEILELQLGARLPAFEEARRNYIGEEQKLIKELVAQARHHTPADLDAHLRAVSEKERTGVFRDWINKKVSADTRLKTLRKKFMSYGDVVPMALTLGTVKLRRAAGASGALRKQLLSRAEQVFLAIQGEASGAPSYHLGLGQVYYRLGKHEAGAKEFKTLLARKDPALSLAVCRAYRLLGMVKESRRETKRLYETAPSPHKQHAAQMMALLAHDDDERQKWLERADSKDSWVRTSLLEVKARKLQRARKYKEADRMWAKVVAFFRKTAKTNSSAANNAALALQSRYLCTWKAAYLEEANRLLEQARQLAPDNALILTNQSEVLSVRLSLALFGQYYPLSLLRRAEVSATTVVGWLLAGPKGKSVRAQLRKSPHLVRLLAAARQAEILGPSRTGPYATQKGWLALAEDLDGLRALAQRLGRVKTLDVAQADALRKKSRTKAQLREGIELTKKRIAAIERLKARSGGDKVVRAALLLREATGRTNLATVQKDAKQAKLAAKLMAEAKALHPTFGVFGQQVHALLLTALLEEAAANGKLAKHYEALHLDYGTITLLFHLIKTGAGLVRSVMRRPTAKAAVALLRKHLAGDRLPELSHLMLAHIAADPPLIARTAAVRKSDLHRVDDQIDLRLDPQNKGMKLRVGLFAR